MLQLGSRSVSVEIKLTPLNDQGLRLMDALEARIEERPYRTSADTGSRTYWLKSDSATSDAFDRTLDEIDPDWREHLTR
jgi:hypothetical protein